MLKNNYKIHTALITEKMLSPGWMKRLWITFFYPCVVIHQGVTLYIWPAGHDTDSIENQLLTSSSFFPLITLISLPVPPEPHLITNGMNWAEPTGLLVALLLLSVWTQQGCTRPNDTFFSHNEWPGNTQDDWQVHTVSLNTTHNGWTRISEDVIHLVSVWTEIITCLGAPW